MITNQEHLVSTKLCLSFQDSKLALACNNIWSLKIFDVIHYLFVNFAFDVLQEPNCESARILNQNPPVIQFFWRGGVVKKIKIQLLLCTVDQFFGI